MITAHSPSTEARTDPPSPTAAETTADTTLAAAIDAQAKRVDQLSAAILRATSQLSWSGRAADRFRDRAAERARECLQLAVALRASADRVHNATPRPEPAPRSMEHAR